MMQQIKQTEYLFVLTNTKKDEGITPIGKGVQYSTIETWNSWMYNHQLPLLTNPKPSIHVNESWYPYCLQHGLQGRACFFGSLNATEDFGELERDALVALTEKESLGRSNDGIPDQAVRDIQRDIALLSKSSPEERTKLPALGQLLFFAHIGRMRFRRQPSVRDFYNKHRATIWSKKLGKRPSKSTHSTIQVSLHMRRADSCNHKQTGFERKASPLDSMAQVSGKRLCYDTNVYVEALRRIQTISGKPALDVYLATDHAGSMLDEIRDGFPDDFYAWNWHFSNYTRDTFEYEGFIDGHSVGETKQAMLGETAVADLWHLSHGQVFAGHLGSRFGKVSWLLATAQRNTFVPFFTVDDHSFCCEIDEPCGEMRPYITSMENCMTFAHDLVTKDRIPNYWEVGSHVRKEVAERFGKKFAVGERVQGNWHMKGTYYSGVVTATSPGSITIQYDDDGSFETLPIGSVRGDILRSRRELTGALVQ